jgi:hypothetical protein
VLRNRQGLATAISHLLGEVQQVLSTVKLFAADRWVALRSPQPKISEAPSRAAARRGIQTRLFRQGKPYQDTICPKACSFVHMVRLPTVVAKSIKTMNRTKTLMLAHWPS